MRRRGPQSPIEIANHLAEVLGRKFAPHFDGKIERNEVFGFARIGAAEALHHWDGRGHFEKFAAQRIRWAILREGRRWILKHPVPGSSAPQHALIAAERAADSVDETPEELTTTPRELADQSIWAYRLDLKLAAEEALDASDHTDRSIDSSRVRPAVRALPPPEDIIVTRHALDEESFEHIGQSLGMAKSTVADIYRRALRRLMTLLDPPPPSPAPPPPTPLRRPPASARP